MRPTFGIACWLLALLAFVQLITVGTALTVRSGSPSQTTSVMAHHAPPIVSVSDEPLKIRTLKQILADAGTCKVSEMPTDLKTSNAHDPVKVSARSESATSVSDSSYARAHAHANPLSTIANPRVERLLQEARNLHLEGDVMRAMLKLDEAGRIDPAECAVIYQKGILFEDMGSYTRAADQYQQIQQMGLLKAGAYYSLAANKLTKGMDTASVRRNTIAIGPMKVRKLLGMDAGKCVEVAVTLLARPDRVIQPDDVEVQVYFYDKVNGGEIKKAAANASISPCWMDDKVDWLDAGNEETLKVAYRIPQGDLAEEHLLGRREFYGCVVELLYKGEVVDQQACPRRLNSIHRQETPVDYQQDFGMPWIPGDDNDLLPNKELGIEENVSLPSR
jgi:hypothetical protein